LIYLQSSLVIDNNKNYSISYYNYISPHYKVASQHDAEVF